MDWIEQHVAIGNYLEAKDRDLLRREGIHSVLSLDGTLSGTTPDSLGLRAIEVIRLADGPGNDKRLMNLAINALSRLAKEASPVLVQCHAGRSRSVVVVAGYLMRHARISAQDALHRVLAKRESNVTPCLVDLLENVSPS